MTHTCELALYNGFLIGVDSIYSDRDDPMAYARFVLKVDSIVGYKDIFRYDSITEKSIYDLVIITSGKHNVKIGETFRYDGMSYEERKKLKSFIQKVIDSEVMNLSCIEFG